MDPKSPEVGNRIMDWDYFGREVKAGSMVGPVEVH